MRRRGKIDTVQPQIVTALRKAGAGVLSLADIGDGAADLLVYSPFTQRLHLLECKSRKGKLTPDQVEVHRRWQIQIVRSVDEAFQAIGCRQ